ncbi:MAG: homogentisate 1,2-dioxygenase [Sphingobium sp.]|nr:homogentisate 1,2-dioxygenase [Sphingobium sp.]
MKTLLALTALSVAVPAVARAQASAPAKACTGVVPALPPELVAWSNKAKLTAAVDPADLGAARIIPGKAIDARLSSGAKVHFGDGPGRAKDVGDNAGIFTFNVDRPGTYRVALGSGGWVDVIEDGKAVTSSAHGHGAECSGIVKMVDFQLKAGEHVLQVEGSKEATVGILIARLP